MTQYHTIFAGGRYAQFRQEVDYSKHRDRRLMSKIDCHVTHGLCGDRYLALLGVRSRSSFPNQLWYFMIGLRWCAVCEAGTEPQLKPKAEGNSRSSSSRFLTADREIPLRSTLRKLDHSCPSKQLSLADLFNLWLRPI